MANKVLRKWYRAGVGRDPVVPFDQRTKSGNEIVQLMVEVNSLLFLSLIHQFTTFFVGSSFSRRLLRRGLIQQQQTPAIYCSYLLLSGFFLLLKSNTKKREKI